MFKDAIPSPCSRNILFKRMFPFVAFALLAFSLTAHALPVPPPPQVAAKSFVLMDANSRQIIAQDHATERSEPASLTKLMAVYVVFQALRDGTLKLDDTATVSEKAWRTGGSRTFLELNSRVTIDELLHGVITQSGNDATVALAERMAGTEDAFVQLMNEYALKVGMMDSHFVDASGMTNDPQHYVTARDLAILSRALIKEFPQYQHYFTEKYYTWNNIRQPNRNRLLFSDSSVDGLKTGYTQKAGYCLIVTAKREKLRLIAVVMGSKSEQARANDAEALLNFGSNFFESRKLYAALAVVDDVKVWKGAQGTVSVGSLNDVYITLPKKSNKDFIIQVSADNPLIAPIPDRFPAGTLKVMVNDQTLASVPIHTLSSVPEGNIFRRAIDSAKMWINTLELFPTIQ